MCDLVEKGVDIPRSETEIYSKRLTLLCGDYDHHKSISRVSFTRDALELASYKMAYKMHTRGTRTATKSNLILWLSESEGFPYSLEACTRVVEELIDPCNVLVYDNLLEQYSFGHFRFQEHLVSVEISNNRGIELVQYLTSDWWRGVLFLFAQKNEISFLIEEVQKSLLTLSSAETTLRYMIEARPKAERKVLYDLLDNFLTLERSEGPLDFDQDAFPHHIDSADLAKYL